MNDEFATLVKKYRRSPEFMAAEITDPNQHGVTGDTLLHAAVTRGDMEDVEILLRYGADVNATGDLGNTPLHHAASRGRDAIVKLLVAHGARRDVCNEFGQRPIDLAKVSNHMSVMTLLGKAGSS